MSDQNDSTKQGFKLRLHPGITTVLVAIGFAFYKPGGLSADDVFAIGAIAIFISAMTPILVSCWRTRSFAVTLRAVLKNVLSALLVAVIMTGVVAWYIQGQFQSVRAAKEFVAQDFPAIASGNPKVVTRSQLDAIIYRYTVLTGLESRLKVAIDDLSLPSVPLPPKDRADLSERLSRAAALITEGKIPAEQAQRFERMKGMVCVVGTRGDNQDCWATADQLLATGPALQNAYPKWWWLFNLVSGLTCN